MLLYSEAQVSILKRKKTGHRLQGDVNFACMVSYKSNATRMAHETFFISLINSLRTVPFITAPTNQDHQKASPSVVWTENGQRTTPTQTVQMGTNPWPVETRQTLYYMERHHQARHRHHTPWMDC